MAHTDWLADALSEINLIHQRIGGLMDEMIAITDKAEAIQQTSAMVNRDLSERGQRDSVLHQIHMDARDALKNATDLGHETEIVLDADAFIRQVGIDLDRILDEIKVGPGGQARVRQRDSATISSRSDSTAPQAIADGEIGIRVPLVMDLLGQHITFDLDFNATVVRESTSNQFRLTGSRNAHLNKLMPTRMLARMIREKTDRELATRLSRTLPQLPSINLGLGEPSYYTSAFDGEAHLMRFFGTYGRKRRQRTRRIEQLPDWAQVGVKTSSEVFVKMVHDQIRAAGLIPGNVSFIGNGRFRTTATAVSSNTTRILCTDFGVTVHLTFFIEGHLYPIGVSGLRLQARQYQSVKPDIKYHPRAVDFLLRWADGYVESIIAAMVPAVQFGRDFYVPGARRLEVDLSAERFLAFIKLH